MSKAELGFVIEERAGVMVLQWNHAGCRPAERTEVEMWEMIRALDASHQRLKEALNELDLRLKSCGNDPISARDAYDSFYQSLVSTALEQAKALS